MVAEMAVCPDAGRRRTTAGLRPDQAARLGISDRVGG